MYRIGHGTRTRHRLMRNKWNVEGEGVFEALLQAVADAMGVIFGLDQRDRNVGLVIEDIIGSLGLPTTDQLPANNNPTLRKADLLADLQHFIPAPLAQRRGDELGADVPLTEAALLNHGGTTFRPGRRR